jgi:predicted LPLAT superfamily acyltransferase
VPPAEWSELRERGATWGLQFVVVVYKVLGRTACRVVLAPITLYFYLAGAAQRRASLDYLGRCWKAGLLPRKPGFWDGFRHFLGFSYALLDKLAAWTGKIRATDVDGVSDGLFDAAKKSGRGAIVLTAHLGNPEVVRAIATVAGRFRVNVLMHTIHAERFNRILTRLSPDSPVRLVQVTEIDVGVAMRLSEAVERGEWIVMTGDRAAVKDGRASAAPVPFLGEEALFPTGPYVLASALKCPAYTMFCLRQPKGRFRVMFEPFDDPVRLPRAGREEAAKAYAARYVERLEKAVALAPFQWFNFYDYWAAPKQAAAEDQPT